MATVLGMKAKLFRGAAGATAATEMTNVKNVTLNMTKSEADVTTRGNNGWRAMVGTLKEGSVSFEMNYDTADADFTALQSAFLTDTPLAFFVSDGNGCGLDGDFSITEFNEDQQLEEAVTVSVTIKLTASNRAPQWIGAVSSGS